MKLNVAVIADTSVHRFRNPCSIASNARETCMGHKTWSGLVRDSASLTGICKKDVLEIMSDCVGDRLDLILQIP